MDFKKFWKESLGGFILKQIILAVVILVALSWITLYLIDIYTEHGKFEKVPDMRGLYVEQAQLMAQNHNLTLEIIDSVYLKDKKPGCIIEQTPAPGSHLKSNRPVYIVVNSGQKRVISIPDVNDISVRQAESMLKSLGLQIDSVSYIPSEYKDLVLEVKYRGRTLTEGTKIPDGSYVTLIVGSGESGGDIVVPSLKGMDVETARKATIDASMVLGAIDFDVEPRGREKEYFIYRQSPSAGKTVPAGTRIDIWLSRDKSMLDRKFDDDDSDENFF